MTFVPLWLVVALVALLVVIVASSAIPWAITYRRRRQQRARFRQVMREMAEGLNRANAEMGRTLVPAVQKLAEAIKAFNADMEAALLREADPEGQAGQRDGFGGSP